MIVNQLWTGSGLGNQLANYITTRCIALDLKYEFGIQHPERFKGKSFLNLDFGKEVVGGFTEIEGQTPKILPDGMKYYFQEKTVRHANGSDISPYDWDILNIKDNTMINGLFQGEEYFKKYKYEIREWLKLPYMIPMKENQCIINFRGGEYQYVPDFFLPKIYWDNAIKNMKKIRSDMYFHVVTDDPITARKFFHPSITISHDMMNDYIAIQSAPYLILSNSSFAFFPAWLNQNLKCCIAPKYWGRHNISDGYWSIDQNYTYGWQYQDRNGNLTMDK